MSRRPKVLHTMTWLAPGGGADRNVYLSMKEMREDYDLHLAVGRQIERDDLLKLDGVSVHICPYLDREIKPWRDLCALIWFIKLMRYQRFDLIHTHETKASLLGRLAARWVGCRQIIYGLHGVVFNDPVSKLKRWFYIFVEKMTVSACDFIISVSRDAITHYHRQNIGCHIPWQVVYSGIDVVDFERRLHNVDRDAFCRKIGIPVGTPVLVNVGRFSQAKAQHYTIEVFSRLQRLCPEMHLLLVGDGPERATCEQLCQELGVADRVIFAGFFQDITPAYAIASVHVLTSLREGLSSVTVEAALGQVPTVSFEVEGIREIVTHGQTGFVVPQGDIDAMVEHVQQLIDDPDMCQAFGHCAYQHAISRWDHRVMVRQLNEIYQTRLETNA